MCGVVVLRRRDVDVMLQKDATLQKKWGREALGGSSRPLGGGNRNRMPEGKPGFEFLFNEDTLKRELRVYGGGGSRTLVPWQVDASLYVRRFNFILYLRSPRTWLPRIPAVPVS